MRVDTTVTLIAIAAGKSDPTHPLTSLRFRDSSPPVGHSGSAHARVFCVFGF